MSQISIRMIKTNNGKLVLQEQGGGRLDNNWYDVTIITEQEEEEEFKKRCIKDLKLNMQDIIENINRLKIRIRDGANTRQNLNYLKWYRDVLREYE